MAPGAIDASISWVHLLFERSCGTKEMINPV